MADSLFAGLGKITQLSDIFKQSAENITKSINVASLAKVISISKSYPSESEGIGYGIASVELIPAITKDGKQIEAYFFSDNFQVNDIVLTVFTDRDFRDTISQPQGINRQTTNKTLHARTFGVLIKL